MSDTDDGGNNEDGFLGGWSRRKLAARRKAALQEPSEGEAGAAPVADAAIDASDADHAAVLADAEPAEPEADDDFIASLPAIGDITAATDVTPFLRRGVPLALRNAALRKIWMENPLIRDHVDPALDYAWDWNAPGGVPGGGGTLTGSGVARMVKHLFREHSPEPGAERRVATDMPPEGGDQAVTSAAEAGAPDRPDESMNAAGTGARSADPVDTDDAANRDEARAKTGKTLVRAAVRRHGGALPQ